MLPPAEAETVIKELLVPLPSFSRGSKQGVTLMDVLLDAAKASWKAETPQASERSSLPRTRIYLDLASDILSRGLGQATSYLRFHLTSFVSKATLQSLSDDAQCLVITHVADALKLVLEMGCIHIMGPHSC